MYMSTRGFFQPTAIIITPEISLLRVSGYLRAALRNGSVGDILESKRSFGDIQNQKQRERGFCSDPEHFLAENLSIVSHPEFLLEYQLERQENEMRGGVQVGEGNIIISCGKGKGAAFIEETFKSKTAKEVT